MNSLMKRIWESIRGDSLAMFGMVVLLLLITVSAFAPFIATHDPNEMNYRSEGSVLWISEGRTRLQAAITEDTLRSVVKDGEGFLAAGESGVLVTLPDESSQAWVTIETGTEHTLRNVSSGGRYAAAVGDSGTALVRDETGTWTLEETGTDAALMAVSICENGTAVAVGTQGTVLLRSSGAWQQIPSHVNQDLLSVSLVDESFGFITGQRGVMLQWDGSSVERIMLDTFRDLLSVNVIDHNYGLAVGERGTVVKWDGSVWSEMDTPLSRSLRSVSIASPGDAMVVGAFGDMMKLREDVWVRFDSGYSRHFRGSAVTDSGYLAVGTDPYINALSPPSRDHYFGTTHNGRDIFSQVIYGGRTALMIGFLAAIMVTLIGTNVGLISGYFLGFVDSALMRFVDIMYALPLEPFAMILVLIWRPGVGVIILAVGLLTWRTTARLIRSQVLSLVKRPFIKAAKVAGNTHGRIMYIHIAPNVLPLAFLQLAVAMAFAITAEATLSFLGLGPPRLHSWGTILHQARLSGAWRTAWWWIIPPGVLIMITVVSVFFISRALEVIANPRLQKR